MRFKNSNFIATASTISAGSLPTRTPQVHPTVSCLCLKLDKVRPSKHSIKEYVFFFKVPLIIRKMIFNFLEFKDCVWRVIWNNQDRELIAGSSRSLKVCFVSQTEKCTAKYLTNCCLFLDL